MILYGIKAVQAECLPQNFKLKDDVKTFSVSGATKELARQKLNETLPGIGLVQRVEMEEVSLRTENNFLEYMTISRNLNAHIGRFAEWECQKNNVHYVTVAIPKSEISYLPDEYRKSGHILNNHKIQKLINFNKLNKLCPNANLITIDIFPLQSYSYTIRAHLKLKRELRRGTIYISCNGGSEILSNEKRTSFDSKGKSGLVVRYWNGREFKYEDHSRYWGLELSKQYPLEILGANVD